jgi:endonuclease YncB( thermonuclease family)
MRAPARLFFAVALAAVAQLAAAQPAELYGRVVGITDGDTITLLDRANGQPRIRLSGIDAPEKAQPFGEVARQNLARLVFDRNVRAECPKEDRYRRLVCTVFDGSRDVSLAQLDAGLAWWFRKYADEQPAEERVAYEAAEDKARLRRVGLWSDADPVPPWEWRKQ